jgi:catechol 1,2-dioxygenase
VTALRRHPYRRPPAFHHQGGGICAAHHAHLRPHDRYFNSDAVFGVKESLLADSKLIHDPKRAKELGFKGDFWDVEHDFVLAQPQRKG